MPTVIRDNAAAKDRPVLFIRGFPLDVKKALRILALEEDRTMGAVVADAIRQYLERKTRIK